MPFTKASNTNLTIGKPLRFRGQIAWIGQKRKVKLKRSLAETPHEHIN